MGFGALEEGRTRATRHLPRNGAGDDGETPVMISKGWFFKLQGERMEMERWGGVEDEFSRMRMRK